MTTDKISSVFSSRQSRARVFLSLMAESRDKLWSTSIHPQFDVNVDRQWAQLLGLSENDVANSVLFSLSSSAQVARNYWVNPQNGVQYLVAVQTPQYQVDSLNALNDTPVVAS